MRPSRAQQLTICIALVAMLLALVTPVGAAQDKGAQQVGTDARARNSWIVTLDEGTNPATAGIALSNAAGGQRGVEKALGNLAAEIERGMKLMGVTRLDQLSREHLRYRR